MDAKLLILDEPTAALGGAETEALFQQMRKLRAEGVGIIYISHRLEEIRQITDRIVVLRDGERVAEFADSATFRCARWSKAWWAEAWSGCSRPIPRPKSRVVLEVRGLTAANGAFRDVSFSVAEGEILGIAGLVGAGRTELVRAIAGADPVSDGTIRLDGRELSPTSPADAIARGHRAGARGSQAPGPRRSSIRSARTSSTRTSTRSRTAAGSRPPRAAFADGAIKKFGVKGRGGQPASQLSGGNQQKVVIAKWLARGPRVVILDEPTRGIDVGARSGIYDIIVGLAERGVAVIVVSSDLEEVLGVSNRIVVLAQGKQAGILDRADANDVSVMELATI